MQTVVRHGCALPGTPASSSSLDRLGNKATAASKIHDRDQAHHGHRGKARRCIMTALSMRCAQRAPDEEPSDTDSLDRRSYNLHCCNTYPKIWVTPSGLPAVVWGQCRDRMCPRCAHYRSKRVSVQVSEKLIGCDALRFITLTLAYDGNSLSHRLDRLYNSFRILRRRNDWKERVFGGVAVVEVTHNPDLGNWNVHLHLIADGLFFDQGLLSEMWEDVTGDSRVTFIKAVYDRSGCGDYIAKYVNKPSDVVGWDFGVVREFALAMSGRRLVLTWGSLHGRNVDTAPTPEHEGMDRQIADCNEVAHRADSGNPWSIRAIQLSQVLGPNFAGAFGEFATDDYDPEEPPAAVVYEEFVEALKREKTWRAGKATPTDTRQPGTDNP